VAPGLYLERVYNCPCSLSRRCTPGAGMDNVCGRMKCLPGVKVSGTDGSISGSASAEGNDGGDGGGSFTDGVGCGGDGGGGWGAGGEGGEGCEGGGSVST